MEGKTSKGTVELLQSVQSWNMNRLAVALDNLFVVDRMSFHVK